MPNTLFFPAGTVSCPCPETSCTFPCCTGREIAVELYTMKDDGDGGILCKGICYQQRPAIRYWVPYEDTIKQSATPAQTIEDKHTPHAGTSTVPTPPKRKTPGRKGSSHFGRLGETYQKVRIDKNGQDIFINNSKFHITSQKIWDFLDEVVEAHFRNEMAHYDHSIMNCMTSTEAIKLSQRLIWEEYPIGDKNRRGNTKYTGRVGFKV